MLDKHIDIPDEMCQKCVVSGCGGKMNNPCINCTKRYPAATCPEGLLRKARQEKIKEARRQEYNIALYKYERIYETKKKVGLI